MRRKTTIRRRGVEKYSLRLISLCRIEPCPTKIAWLPLIVTYCTRYQIPLSKCHATLSKALKCTANMLSGELRLPLAVENLRVTKDRVIAIYTTNCDNNAI